MFWQDWTYWVTEDGQNIFYYNNVGINTDSGDTLTANLTVKSDPAQIANAIEVWDSNDITRAFVEPDGDASFRHVAAGNNIGSLILPNAIVNIDGAVNADVINNGYRVRISQTGGTAALTAINAIAIGNTTNIGNLTGVNSRTTLNFGATVNPAADLKAFGGLVDIQPTSTVNIAFGDFQRMLNGGTITSSAQVIRAAYTQDSASATADNVFLFKGTVESSNVASTVNRLRGLGLEDWTAVPAITRSYAIFIDNTTNVGTVESWAIKSESLADSELDGQLKAPGMSVNIQTLTAGVHVADEFESIFLSNTTGGDVTITLPDPSTLPVGREYKVKQITTGNNTIVQSASGLVEFGATYTMGTKGEAITLHTNGVDWFIF